MIACINQLCGYCEEPVEEPQIENSPCVFTLEGARRAHIECAVRAVMGSAAHQLGDCSCCGGTRHDPPGMTQRQAARLALDTFLMLHPQR
jgi:hypothetical protein